MVLPMFYESKFALYVTERASINSGSRFGSWLQTMCEARHWEKCRYVLPFSAPAAKWVA